MPYIDAGVLTADQLLDTAALLDATELLDSPELFAADELPGRAELLDTVEPLDAMELLDAAELLAAPAVSSSEQAKKARHPIAKTPSTIFLILLFSSGPRCRNPVSAAMVFTTYFYRTAHRCGITPRGDFFGNSAFFSP